MPSLFTETGLHWQELRDEHKQTEKQLADEQRGKRQLEDFINHKKSEEEEKSLAQELKEVMAFYFPQSF